MGGKTTSNSEILNDQFEKEVFSGDLRVLNEIRIKYVNNVVIGHLNINSLANKFEKLKPVIKDTLDALVIVETKIDNSYPEEQFKIEGFSKPYRLDRNAQGGGIIVYIRENIPSKQLKKHQFTKNMETLFIELNFRKSKLLLIGTYHSNHPEYGTTDTDYFEQMGLALDVYCMYDRFLIAGDLNAQEEENCLKHFMDQYGQRKHMF